MSMPPTSARRPETMAGRKATPDDLKKLCDVPSITACQQLGLGLTALKKACRQSGLQRWTRSPRMPAQEEASAARFCSPMESTGEPRVMPASAWPPATVPVIKPTPSRGGVQAALLALLVATPAATIPAAETQSSSSGGQAAPVPAMIQWLTADQGHGRSGHSTATAPQPSALCSEQDMCSLPATAQQGQQGKGNIPWDSLLRWSGQVESHGQQGRLATEVHTDHQQPPTSFSLPAAAPGWGDLRYEPGVGQGSRGLLAPLPFTAASPPQLEPSAPAASQPSQPAWRMWPSLPDQDSCGGRKAAAAGSRLPVEPGASGSMFPGQLPPRGSVDGYELRRVLRQEQPQQCSGAVTLLEPLSGLPQCRSSPAAFTLWPAAPVAVAKQGGSLQAAAPPCPVVAVNAHSLPVPSQRSAAGQVFEPPQQGQQHIRQQLQQHDQRQQSPLLSSLPSVPSPDQSVDTWLLYPAAASQPAAATARGVSALQRLPTPAAMSDEPHAVGHTTEQTGASRLQQLLLQGQQRQQQQSALLPPEQTDSDLTAMSQRLQLLQAYAAGARAAREVRAQQAQRAEQPEPEQQLLELLLQQRAWQRAHRNNQRL